MTPASKRKAAAAVRVRRRFDQGAARASTPCASGRACISATPTTARACTTWCTRSWTTPSTRRWPATATAITVTLNADGSVTVERQRPRHPDRHPQGRRRFGRRGDHDPAACRRKVRPELLQGLGRPARRRRLGRQRAVRLAGADASGATARSTSCASRTAMAEAPLRVGRRPPGGKRGTARRPSCRSRKTFTMIEFDFATLEHRLRELAFLNSGVRIMLTDDARRRAEARGDCATKAGLRAFVRYLDRTKTPLIAEPIVRRRRARRHRHRGRAVVERQLPRERALLHQQHPAARRRHASCRLPRRADAHDQHLCRRVAASPRRRRWR